MAEKKKIFWKNRQFFSAWFSFPAQQNQDLAIRVPSLAHEHTEYLAEFELQINNG